MTQEVVIQLTQKGYMAGKRLKNGTMALGAHKITEDEIFTMASTLMRVYAAKTNNDTLVFRGDDGKALILKLVDVKAGGDAPEKEE